MSGEWAFVAVKTSYGIADEQNVDWKRMIGSRSAPTGKDYILDSPQTGACRGYMGREQAVLGRETKSLPYESRECVPLCQSPVIH